MSSKTAALSEKLGYLDITAPLNVEESEPYRQVLQKMRRAGRGCAVVCRKGKISGIFTERDVLQKYILEKIDPKTPIGDMMTARPVTVKDSTTLGRAVELMHAKRARNLPVVDGQGRPKGLLTVGQIIRYLADHFPAEVVNLPPRPGQVVSETDGA